ncbi:RICIN domain-containing protein [Cystobacter fuscus]|nr:glycoside hydrolase family 76 protein [Cystobacter fuscus]
MTVLLGVELYVGAKIGGHMGSIRMRHLKKFTATVLMAASVPALAGNDRADASFDGYNRAFLVKSGGQTFYKKSINDGRYDETFLAALDIQVAEDAYERTGRPDQKALINDLCKTFLVNYPPNWSWNGWNDDIGWFALALVRGYQITGNTEFLNAAKSGFDMAWARGWNTQYNGGGIWEEQPYSGNDPRKEPLSNDSLGKVAVLLYQSTYDRWYLDRATQIYDWVTSHLYDANSGQVYTAVYPDGRLIKDAQAYNQGTFADYAHLLYLTTGNARYYNDAKKAIDYVRNNLTTNGIITTNRTDLDTWADEVARAVGHYARDTRQWDNYYPWMVQNADAIWNNRRTDYNLTWNAWAQKTPSDNTLKTPKHDSAVAWLQYTPVAKPNAIGGIHAIVSKPTGLAIDNGGKNGDGAGIIQWGLNYGQNQKWLFTQNDDSSWNIVSLSSFKALDVPAGNTANDTQLIQWFPNRNDNQRWWVDVQADGSYKIWNKATGGVLDSSNATTNGYKLVQWGWNGGEAQRWYLK